MKRHPAMEIHVAGLHDGEYPFSFDVPAADIDLDETFIGNVKVVGEIRKVSTQYFLRSTVEASCARECDRCLAPTRKDISFPLDIYYRVALDERSSSDDRDDIEMVTIHPDQEAIALDDEVRQAILLQIPLKFLCTDGCLGICPGCGVDLNRERCGCDEAEIDPRWAKLAEVFKKKEEE
jgi:uncharacterized protein